MSSRADILTTAQRAMNTHRRTTIGGCAECKTTRPGPCPVWTLASQVVALVHDSIRRYPPARVGPDDTPSFAIQPEPAAVLAPPDRRRGVPSPINREEDR